MSEKESSPPGLKYRLMSKVMSPVLNLFKMNCRDFAELAAQRLDRPLTSSEARRFQLHKWMCGICRPLPKQFEILGELTRSSCVEEQGDPPAELAPEARDRMRAALEGDDNISDS